MTGELLALFPLNTVLFPGMPLPLHIFEERYKLMIGRCMEEKRPFGVVLIRSGPEVGGTAVPHAVGTTAQITTVKHLGDGRMNLLVVGQERFRIVEVVREEPYMVGQVSPVVDAEPETGLEQLANQVHRLLMQYLRDLFTLVEQPYEELSVPREPGPLSLIASAVMQIALPERQSLLEMTDVGQRLAQLREWLQRETEHQAALLGVKRQLGPVKPLDPAQELGKLSLN
jgi:uncharacterized protein